MERKISEEKLNEAAEAVRAACLRAAMDGYERAGLGGLCEEGRWEMVVDAIQSLDVGAVVRNVVDGSSGLFDEIDESPQGRGNQAPSGVVKKGA